MDQSKHVSSCWWGQTELKMETVYHPVFLISHCQLRPDNSWIISFSASCQLHTGTEAPLFKNKVVWEQLTGSRRVSFMWLNHSWTPRFHSSSAHSESEREGVTHSEKFLSLSSVLRTNERMCVLALGLLKHGMRKWRGRNERANISRDSFTRLDLPTCDVRSINSYEVLSYGSLEVWLIWETTASKWPVVSTC